MRESEAREHMLEAIASSRGGVIGWAKTSDILLAAYHDGTTHADTIDLPHGTITQVHGARVIQGHFQEEMTMNKKGAALTMIGFGVGMIVGCTTASVVADSPPETTAQSKPVEKTEATEAKKKRAPIVAKLGDIPLKVAPNGMARATMFATGEEAYFGMLELEPGASVPEHADPTEEFIYVVEGQGTMTIDGVAYKVTPQTAIYMPAGAKVSFENDSERLVAFQVFGNPGPQSKYDGWGTP